MQVLHVIWSLKNFDDKDKKEEVIVLNKLTELLEYEVDNMQYNRQQERETVDELELHDVPIITGILRLYV